MRPPAFAVRGGADGDDRKRTAAHYRAGGRHRRRARGRAAILARPAAPRCRGQSLAATLGLVLVVGLLAGLVAVRAVLRTELLPALREE